MKKIIALLIILGASLWIIWHLPSKNDQAKIADFLSCQKAGRPIIETYPRVCQGADGKSYTEIVDEKALNTDPVVFSPDLSRPVTSPLTLQGEARGFWFFEQQFEVRLLDAEEQIIATGTAKTKSSALTVEFVPFNITLNFKKPRAKMGFIVLEKANPSGLASQNRIIQLPILFQAPNIDTKIDQLDVDNDKTSTSTPL